MEDQIDEEQPALTTAQLRLHPTTAELNLDPAANLDSRRPFDNQLDRIVRRASPQAAKFDIPTVLVYLPPRMVVVVVGPR